jgi:hypothetical protein
MPPSLDYASVTIAIAWLCQRPCRGFEVRKSLKDVSLRNDDDVG